jgi:hypothetical protein
MMEIFVKIKNKAKDKLFMKRTIHIKEHLKMVNDMDLDN